MRVAALLILFSLGPFPGKAQTVDQLINEIRFDHYSLSQLKQTIYRYKQFDSSLIIGRTGENYQPFLFKETDFGIWDESKKELGIPSREFYSRYRQNFCFLVRREELDRAIAAMESALALELAHGYLRPIQVDRNVGLLAAVGEGMQGKPGLASRIFTAISRADVNIIAISQGSSELTIAVVVRREGLEKAVKAVHEECDLGRPPVPAQPS